MNEEKDLTQTSETVENQVQEDFEVLIRGKYKEQFDARVQGILDKRLRALRQENQQLTAEREQRRSRARQALEALSRQQQAMEKLYPGFQWQQELRDPAFGRLITAGVDARTAYEVVHRREVLRTAMDYAARRAREQTARAVASGSRRVRENGGGAGSVSRSDPSTLTSQELADIRKRVFDGEKIRF